MLDAQKTLLTTTASAVNSGCNYPEDVTNEKLNCHLTQRSGDIALGIPFNLACYATLTHMVANETGLEVGEFSHYINDAHIYMNHVANKFFSTCLLKMSIKPSYVRIFTCDYHILIGKYIRL